MDLLKKIVSLCILASLMACSNHQTIAIDDYVNYTVFGVNEHGTVIMDVDSQLLNVLLEDKNLSLYQANQLFESISFEYSKPLYSFENGDEIDVNLSYTPYDNIKLSMEELKIAITDLPQGSIITQDSILEKLNPTVLGVHPRGYLKLSEIPDDEFPLSYFDFVIENNGSFRTNDVATIKIIKPIDFDLWGYQMDFDSLTYPIKHLGQVIDSPSYISDEMVDTMVQKGLEAIENNQLAMNLSYRNYMITGIFSPYHEYQIDDESNLQMSNLRPISLSLVNYSYSDHWECTESGCLDTVDEDSSTSLFYMMNSEIVIVYRADVSIFNETIENGQVVVKYQNVQHVDGVMISDYLNQDNYTVDLVVNRQGEMYRHYRNDFLAGLGYAQQYDLMIDPSVK